MSLLNLLSVGNSLSTIVNRPNRYRMNPDTLLPHFGAEELDSEPNGSESLTGGDEAPHPDAARNPREEKRPMPSARPASWSFSEPASMTASSEENAKPAPIQKGRKFRKTFFLRQRPSRETEALQCELPWEDIPVARNDLNDADVEVIQAAQITELSPPKVSNSGKLQGTRQFLERIRTRFFRTGKV